MRKFRFSVTIEVTDSSEEEAIEKVETYCRVANSYAEQSKQMHMRFILHGLDGEAEYPETEEQLSNMQWKAKDIKNLN